MRRFKLLHIVAIAFVFKCTIDIHKIHAATPTVPANQAVDIVFSQVTNTSMKLSWTNGDGEKRAVFMIEGSVSGIPPIAYNATYPANTVFGSSNSRIGTSDWYCVYNNSGSSVTVTGLKANTLYHVVVFEYNGAAGSEQYNAASTSNNPNEQTTTNTVVKPTFPFQESFVGELPPVRAGSVDFGDYDNDNDLDLLITGFTDAGSSEIISKVYKNDGTSFTEDVTINITPVNIGTAVWGDYDNDGKLDIFITGSTDYTGKSSVSKIYHNTGTGFTEVFAGTINPALYSSAVWCDYNNDGKQDIALTGRAGLLNFGKLFKNTGTNFESGDSTLLQTSTSGNISYADYNNDGFGDLLITSGTPLIFKNLYGLGFEQDYKGKLADAENSYNTWNDFDNDGDLDLIIMGNSSNPGSRLYLKTDTGFTEVYKGSLTPLYNGSAAWGDYDNDGLSDLFITGSYQDNTNAYSKLYRNTGNGFTEVFADSFPAVNYSSVAWADVDNNGTMDLLISGFNPATNKNIIKFYKNTGSTLNNTPSAPANLKSTVNGYSVTLNWDNATDAEGNTLSYNVYVGTQPGSSNINSSNSNISTGYYKLAKPGNTSLSNKYIIKNLPIGTYYWSVQSVDPTYKGSAFATEATFTVVKPVQQKQTIIFSKSNPIKYGDADLDAPATVSSGLPLDFASSDTNIVSIIDGKVHVKKAGSFYLIASNDGDDEFLPVLDSSQYTVLKKDLTISVENITRLYGQKNSAFKLTYSGFVNNDSKDSIDELPVATCAADSSSPVGSYPIFLTGGSDTNYVIKLKNGSLTVKKALLFAVAEDKTKICGENDPAYTIRYVGFVNNDDETDIIKPLIASTNYKSYPVGKYPIELTGGDANNYSINLINGYITINPIGPFTQNALICNGDSIQLKSGLYVSKKGTYYDTISNGGCDTLYIFNLTVVEPNTKSISTSICTGSSYSFGGKTYTQTGFYKDTVKSVLGCDSIYVFLDLEVDEQPLVEILGTDTTICAGEPIALTANGNGIVAWQGYNSNALSLLPLNTAIYTAHSITACGKQTASIKVTVNPVPEKPSIIETFNGLATDGFGAIEWYEVTNGKINGESDNIYKPKVSGRFYVSVIDNGCKSPNSDTISYTTTNIILANGQVLKYYPNPVVEKLTIENSAEQVDATIYNNLGKEVKKLRINSGQTLINFADYPKGIYLLKLVNTKDKSEKVLKILKVQK